MTIYGHFLYNLYIFCLIQHICLANMVFALDLSNSVIKRLSSRYFCTSPRKYIKNILVK